WPPRPSTPATEPRACDSPTALRAATRPSSVGCHRPDAPNATRPTAASGPDWLRSPAPVRNRTRCAICRPIRIDVPDLVRDMAQPDCAGPLQAQLPALFFKPVHLHAQFANLLVELGHRPLMAFADCLRRLEELRQMIPNDRFPLRHLHWMHF